MIRYLLKIAVRNLRKNWVYTFINIAGLTVGLVCLVIIGLWIKYELSYDRFEKNHDRIYRLTVEINQENGIHSHFARSGQKWINQLPGSFPAIESMARFSPLKKTAVKYDEIKFNNSNVFQADAEALDIFSIRLIEGDPDKVLKGPQKIILAKSIADRYFKGIDIVGKMIGMAGIFDTTFVDYQVAGIFRDFPQNSHLHPQILVSMDNPKEFYGWAYTYLLLHKGSSPNDITANFGSFAEKYLKDDEKSTSTIHLQKLSRIHLYSDKDREIESNGDIKLVVFFGIIGIIIFGLALINYVNLSLAMIFRRKKNLVINKVFGAKLQHVFGGFFTESLLLFILSVIASAILLLNFGQFFSGFIPAGYLIQNLGLLSGFIFVLVLAASVIVSMPQLLFVVKPFSFSHEFFPQKTGLIRMLNSRRTGIRRLLVISQFTASVILIICAIYFTRQKNYMMNHRLGNSSEPVVLLGNLNWQVKDRYFQFRNLALQDHHVKSVTGAMQAPSTQILDAMPFTMSGMSSEQKNQALYVSPVDNNFFDFFKIKLIAGHDFTRVSRDSLREEYILNETALHYLGYNDPSEIIGREFKPTFNMKGIFNGGTIVGVVRDFCYSTMKTRIKPLVFFQKPIWYWNFMVKIDSVNTGEGIRYLKSVWDKVYPEYVFDYSFNDQSYNTVYKKEITQARLSRLFMVLAMIIATLGLFGLASISTEQRTKEIGIRKVVGAASKDIVLLLNREFTVWVGISVAIALPAAWYLMDRWSTTYAYHAPLSWWIFALAGLSVILVAWITVSYRTVKASKKNPVEVLRQE